MFDVVGLWLLYGTGEHCAVFYKACGSLLSLACVRTHEPIFDTVGRESIILPLESVRCRGRVRIHGWMLRDGKWCYEAERGSISRRPYGLSRGKARHLASLI